jgi:hypothetical protein
MRWLAVLGPVLVAFDPATPGLGLTVPASYAEVEKRQDASRVFRTINLGEPAPVEAAY